MQPAQLGKVAMNDGQQYLTPDVTAHDAIIDLNTGIPDAALFKFGLPFKSDMTVRKRSVRYSIRLYKKMEWRGSTLCEYYAEDFDSFTTEKVLQASAAFHRDLRDTLRPQWVYNRNGCSILLPDAQYEIVQNNLS